MQQLTGKIVSVLPTAEGGYNSKQGWINTFTMTIQGPNSQVAGEIGSKKTPYPLGVGQEIAVEASQTEHGVKFKKFNPQYSGGGGQQGGQQGGGRPSSPNKDRLIVAQVVYKAHMEKLGVCDEDSLREDAEMIMRVGEGKPAPQPQVQPQEPVDLSNPAPADDGDEIPF